MARHPKADHPGLVLEDAFLRPLGLSQNALAAMIGVPSNRINDIVRGRRGITADTDLRLARVFGVEEGSWLQLQNDYDIAVARQVAGMEIRKIRPLRAKK
jgi:antitoxin HigA-1